MAAVLSLASDGGIHSAALAINGEIIAYASEEHTSNNEYPVDLIHYCLGRGNLTENELDQILCSDSPLDNLSYRWNALKHSSGSKSIFEAAQEVTSAIFEASNKQIANKIAAKNKLSQLEIFNPSELLLESARKSNGYNAFVLYRQQGKQIITTFWHYTEQTWKLIADSKNGVTPLDALFKQCQYTPSTSPEAIQLQRLQHHSHDNCSTTSFLETDGPTVISDRQAHSSTKQTLFSTAQIAFIRDMTTLKQLTKEANVGAVFEGSNIAAALNLQSTSYYQKTITAKSLLARALSYEPSDCTAIWNEDSVENWLNDNNVRYRYCDHEQLAHNQASALQQNLVIADISYDDTEGSAFKGQIISGDLSPILEIDCLQHNRELTPTDLLDIAINEGADVLKCGQFWIELIDAKYYRIH